MIRNTLEEKLKRSRERFKAERCADLRRHRGRRLVLLCQFVLVSERRLWRREKRIDEDGVNVLH